MTWAAAPAITRVPTSVEPVNTILRTSGWLTNRSPTTEPSPRQHLEQVGRQAGLDGELTEPDGRQRRPLRRFDQHRVPGGERGRESPRGDGHREVPRRDHADDAQRLVECDVQAAGDRNLLARQAFRGGGIELQHVADVAGFPFRVADRVSGVGHLQCRQLVDVRVHRGGEGAQPGGPLGRGQPCPVPLRGLRTRHRVVDGRLVGLLDGAQQLLGGRIDQI